MKLEQAARALLAHWDTPAWKYLKPTGNLMADLREALSEQERKAKYDERFERLEKFEQAEQEPVAWVDLTKEEMHQIEMNCETSAECYRVIAKALKDRNYAAPVRTKDLTDKQIEKVWQKNGGYMGMPIDFARAVIAADREKNK